jgi:hypothetical protein
MWSLAGNLEGFEEASRALYSRKWPDFSARIASWPEDLRKHLEWMVSPAPVLPAPPVAPLRESQG